MEQAAPIAADELGGIVPRLLVEHLDERVQLRIAARDVVQMRVHELERRNHPVPLERYHQAQTRPIRHIFNVA